MLSGLDCEIDGKDPQGGSRLPVDTALSTVTWDGLRHTQVVLISILTVRKAEER